MTTVFFSYSHKDEIYRDQLEIHLAPLKREGLIDAWHDRRIVAGAELDNEISERLEEAAVILLLVSADFINSDYCYEREMTRALERHKEKQAVVIPVILRPCDWQHMPFGKLRATPADGRPITKFSNLDDAYLEIVQDIRRAVGQVVPEAIRADSPILSSTQGQAKPAQTGKQMRSSNMRLKREFTDKDEDDFLDATFEYIANYFIESLLELKKRNLGIDTDFRRSDKDGFSAAIYRGGHKLAVCNIALSSQLGGGRRIAYAAGELDVRHGFNEMLTVKSDGYAMQLEPLLAMNSHSLLTEQGAAEHLWSMFIAPLQ